MPYKITKVRNSTKYRVVNTDTGEVKAKRTTLKKAKAQVALLEGLEHGTIKVRR